MLSERRIAALSAEVPSRGAVNWLLRCSVSWEAFFRAADREEATNVREGKTTNTLISFVLL